MKPLDLTDLPPVHPRYEPREIIGRGGEGVVHRVFDKELGRDVALKTLRPERLNPDGIEAFLEEARAAAGLEHPNVVPIHDVGVFTDGRPFYTKRLVSGQSLAEVLRGQADGMAADDDDWSLVSLVQVIQQTCRALTVAHDRGIIHRDVKPGNILIGTFGETLLVDWGISKVSGSSRAATATGVVKGTIGYLSPEQARAEPLDARSDL